MCVSKYYVDRGLCRCDRYCYGTFFSHSREVYRKKEEIGRENMQKMEQRCNQGWRILNLNVNNGAHASLFRSHGEASPVSHLPLAPFTKFCIRCAKADIRAISKWVSFNFAFFSYGRHLIKKKHKITFSTRKKRTRNMYLH